MPKYYMVHDKSFMENADLKYFDREILDIVQYKENEYLFNIIKDAPKDAIILDIGAYTGDTSIYLAKKLNTINRNDIRFICFEPNSRLCQHCLRLTKVHNLNIVIVNKIISDKKQILYMKEDQGAGTMYDNCYDSNNIKYESITLDELNIDASKVFFTKIDVEGHEPEVLAGGVKTIKDSKYIYIEMWNDNHFKSRHGHKLSGSHNKRILDRIDNINKNFKPLQKIEKNVIFKNITT
tara:strand:- start:6189 stop:6899 length:711 start_codon:yes stop_codon:yes gene_type:complete